MSRINVKVVLVLGAFLTIAAVGVGALWVLNLKGNTDRLIARGDQFMEQGDYVEAYNQYGRAVSKDKGRLDFLAKLEDAILRIEPRSRDEANELYSSRITILQQAVKYHSTKPEVHRQLLDEVYYVARMTNTEDWWERVYQVAADMHDQLLDGDPARLEADLFMAMATYRRAMTETESALERAEAQLEGFLEANPNSDLGWATAIAARLASMQKAWAQGQEGRARERALMADETFAEALRRVPEGPEVARMSVLHLALKRSRQIEAQGGNENLANDPDIVREVDRLISLVKASEDPALMADTADVLRSISPGYMPQGIELLQACVDADPRRLIHLAILGEMQARADRHADAEATLRRLIDADSLTVSYETKVHDQLRKQGAAQLVDVACRRWEAADEEDKPAAIERAEQAAEELRGLVIDPKNDELYLRASAKLDFLKGNYRTAAAKFDQLSRTESGASAEDVLEYAARSLEEINEIGLAYERMQQLQRRRPGNQRILFNTARLASNLKRFDEARGYCEELLEINPEHPKGRELLSMIKVVLETGGTGEELDPDVRAMNDAVELLQIGDHDSARQTLEGALSMHASKNPQILYMLVQIELSVGDSEAARQYLDQLLEVQPDNKALRQFAFRISLDDPVEAASAYVESLELSDDEHAVASVVHLSRVVAAQQSLAARFRAADEPERAEEAEALVTKAETQLATWLETAMKLAPGSPELQEYRFQKALRDEDWSEAESIVTQATTSNADLADGALFNGQLALARGDIDRAITQLSRASERIPHSSIVWRLLGNAYREAGNFGRAREAYEESYRNNPNDIETIRVYVSLLTRVGDDTRALRVMRTAHRVVPNDLRLREVWLRLEARAGDRRRVLKERRRLYGVAPRDRVNAEQLAAFLATMEPTREMILDERGDPVFTEVAWMQMSTSSQQNALAREKQLWYEQCDDILDGLEGNSLDTAVLRATLLRERGDVTAGQEAITTLVDSTPPEDRSIEMMLALAAYQQDTGQIDEAVATLEDARELQDPIRREAEAALGDLYFRERQFEMAAEAFERATELNSDSEVVLNIIECHIKLGRGYEEEGIEDRRFGRTAEANETFDKAEQHYAQADALMRQRLADRNEGYNEAILRAAIAGSRGDMQFIRKDRDAAALSYADRDAALRRAEELNPTNPQPMIERAKILLREFNQELNAASAEQAEKVKRQSTKLIEALRELARADEVQAGNRHTAFTRVAVYQAKEDMTSAIGELTRLLERHSDDHAARRRLVQLHHSERNVDAAYQTLEAGIRRNPTLTMWHEMKGDLFLDEIDTRRRERRVFTKAEATRLANLAEGAYRELMKLEVSAPAIGKLVASILAREPNRNERRQMFESARTVLRGHDDFLTTNPTLKSLYAIVLAGLGHHDEAEAMLQNAFHQFVEFEQKDVDEPGTINEWYDAVLAVFSSNSAAEIESFLTDLRDGELTTDDYHWLAGVWAAEPDGLSRAMELERRAIDRTAGDEMNEQRAMLHFSLASFLLLDGQNEAATRPLRKVIEFDPFHKSALNNYAFLQATLLGQPQEALPFALRAQKAIHERDTEELKSSIHDTVGWIYFLLNQDIEAETALRKSRIYRETASNSLHMAHLMYRSGDFTQAEDFLIRATELNPDDATQREIDKLATDIRNRRR